MFWGVENGCMRGAGAGGQQGRDHRVGRRLRVVGGGMVRGAWLGCGGLRSGGRWWHEPLVVVSGGHIQLTGIRETWSQTGQRLARDWGSCMLQARVGAVPAPAHSQNRETQW